MSKDEAAVTAIFDLKKTTKGTYVYEERADISHVGSLYVKKYTLGTEPPKQLFVRISWT